MSKPEEQKIVYVTSYLELDRKNWKTYPRSFDDYLVDFLPFVKYMSYSKQNTLLIFIDNRHIAKLKTLVKADNIIILPLNLDNLLKTNRIWKLYHKEKKILESEGFQTLVSHRKNCPETYIPEYTLVNHFKIEVMKMAIELNIISSIKDMYYVWMDFGWFKKGYYAQGIDPMPRSGIDVTKLDGERINYTLLKPLDDNDFDPIYTIRYAPEKIVGGFFAGREDKMLEYIELYYSELVKFQNMALADDDQHILIRCVKEKPDLFKLHVLGSWCAGPIYFQLDKD